MSVSNRKGFALPTTVFIVTLLTIMLAAAFMRTASDHQIADGNQFMEEALSIAESGLERYMESASSRPSDRDSIRINVTGGYAWVHVYSLQKPIDTLTNETFVIASTGYVIEATQGSTPMAERTLAQIAFWQTGHITVPAAYTAANGVLNRRQENAVIDGRAFYPDTSGLRAPSTPNMSGLTLLGVPSGMDAGGSAESIAIETGIDWQSVLDGDMECENDQIFSGNLNTSYESYCIEGDLDLRKWYGTGLLIVTGDLTLTGKWNNAYWYGPVLVGGRVIFNARTSYIRGMLVSGLNEQIQSLPSVPETEIGRNNKRIWIYYDEALVEASLAYLTGLVPIDGTRMDNWAAY